MGTFMRSALRRGAAALLALALPATAAHAVDLYPSAEEDVSPINWTGFIVAPYFGYGTMNLTGNGAKGLDNPQGWRVGGELDYDYQIDRFVVGIAADAFYTWYDSNGSAQQTARLFDYETVRARLGYTFGRWLVFGTGGVAFGDLEVKNAINERPSGDKRSRALVVNVDGARRHSKIQGRASLSGPMWQSRNYRRIATWY